MIIGISGKLKCGKDLTAKIIKYLLWCDHNVEKLSFDEWCDSLALEEYCQIKKFAQPVREVCSIITGIPVDDFDKIEIKDSYWNMETGEVKTLEELKNLYYYTIIIDTVQEYEKIILEEKLNGAWILIRLLLQYEGTNIGRFRRGENCWVNILMRNYKPILKDEYKNLAKDDYHLLNESHFYYPIWVYSDIRFINEAEPVRKRNGILIRLNRKREFSNEMYCQGGRLSPDWNGITEIESTHESETEMDNYEFFKYLVDNNGTVGELIEKIREILIKEKIITKI